MITSAKARCFVVPTLFCVLIGVASHAQTATEPQDDQNQQDPLKRPRTKQKISKTENAYKKWRDEDVSVIITTEELSAFNKLSNDAERANFVEAFWRRRDPTPDTEENEFKEEHYRRLAYADEHFGAGMRGSKTDRGRIYIIHGSPSSIDAHPAGGPYQRTAEEGGGQTSTYPFEIWRYRNIDYIGQEVEVEFVDTCMCGAYHITLDPGEKDAFSKVPNAGLTTRESMGLDTKANRGRNGIDTTGSSFFGNNASKQFERIERGSLLLTPPPIKYKDLKEVVDIKMRYNLLPFGVRVDFIKAAMDTAIVPITIQVANYDLTYVGKDGVPRASVNIYGRVTTLSGQVVNTFEHALRVDAPSELLPKFVGNTSLHQQSIPMHPGRYRLDLVLKDVNGGKLGTLYQSISVPDFNNDGRLSSSSLILADLMEAVPARDTGNGTFVLGPDKVRPRVPPANGNPAVFRVGEKVNLWMQVYNLKEDEASKKTSFSVECRVMNLATKQQVYQQSESPGQAENSSKGLTIRKTFLPETLGPGTYEVTVVVTDLVSQQVISPSAKLMIK